MKKTIVEHIEDFIEYLDVERGLSLKTQLSYSRYLKRFSDWLVSNNFGNLLPEQLSEEIIRKYKRFLSQISSKNKKDFLKTSTKNSYLIAIRALLNYFAEKGIPSLAPQKVKLLKTSERQIKFLELNEIERLLSAPDTSTVVGLRDRAILEVLFSTGMRIGEIISLNVDQFKNLNENEDLEVTIAGKGGRIRTVYFSKRALFWLKKYLEKRKDKEKALFISYRGPKGKIGKRLSERAIENLVKKYSLKAGLKLIATPHTIRHSFATDLLKKGVDVRIVQEFLGHKNLSTTQIYTHVTKPQLREIHKKFHGFKKSHHQS